MATQVSVTLPKSSLVVGETTQPVATVTVNEGDSLLNQRAITWASANPAVATVTATTSLVTVKAVAPGSTQIQATVDGVTGQAPVTVTPPRVDITAAQEAAIKAFPVGSTFVLRGPTTDFTVQVNG